MKIWFKQLNEEFKRSVYWNNNETKPARVIEKGKNLYGLLNVSFKGVKRLFVLAYAIAAGGNDKAGIKNSKKYFLIQEERLKITTYWSIEGSFMIKLLMT